MSKMTIVFKFCPNYGHHGHTGMTIVNLVSHKSSQKIFQPLPYPANMFASFTASSVIASCIDSHVSLEEEFSDRPGGHVAIIGQAVSGLCMDRTIATLDCIAVFRKLCFFSNGTSKATLKWTDESITLVFAEHPEELVFKQAATAADPRIVVPTVFSARMRLTMIELVAVAVWEECISNKMCPGLWCSSFEYAPAIVTAYGSFLDEARAVAKQLLDHFSIEANDMLPSPVRTPLPRAPSIVPMFGRRGASNKRPREEVASFLTTRCAPEDEVVIHWDLLESVPEPADDITIVASEVLLEFAHVFSKPMVNDFF